MKKAISDFADRQGILIEDNFTFGEWEALWIRRGRDLRGFMKAADLVGAKIEAIAAPDDYLHRFGKPLTWEAEELYSDGDEAHEALIRSYLNNPDCIMGLGSYELYERIFVVTDKGTLEVYFEDEDLYITVDSADRSVYAKNHDRYASFDVRKLFGSVKGDTITGSWVMDREGKDEDDNDFDIFKDQKPCITKLSLALESGRRLNFSPYMDVFDFELVNPDGNVAGISFAEVLRCLK